MFRRSARARAAGILLPRVALAAALLAVVLTACSGGSGTSVDTEIVSAASSSRTITADATLQAVHEAAVAPTISGTVSAISVADGQQVHAGDPLFTLDDAALRDQLNAVEGASSSPKKSSSSSSSSAAAQQQADANAAFAKQLAALQLQTTQGLDQLKALAATASPDFGALITTLVSIQELQNNYNLVLYQGLLQTMQADTATQAQAQVAGFSALGAGLSSGSSQSAQAAAQAQQLRREIDATQVDAPIDGVVALATGSSVAGLSGLSGGAGTTTPGEIRKDALVAAGQTVLTVYDLGSVQARALVDETDIPSVAVGQAATVHVDAFPEASLEGRVSRVSVSPTASDGGGNAYAVYVDVPADQLRGWRPGMTSTVDVQIDQARSGIQIPAAAVVTRSGTSYVFKVVNGKAVRTEVQKSTASSGLVLVTKGLTAGDRIVTSGVSDLKDGDAVKPR